MLSILDKPRILECTLRDGSYAIDFQFTEEATQNIVRALEGVGFDLIEVGHGMGLGASDISKWRAVETDETYLNVVAKTVKKADWGMFCIPGIAKLDHIDMAADYGMKFIRIGTDVENYRDSERFIERAKKHGMFVCSNFMKSYVSEPTEFAQYALAVERYGSDLVYIVDSAGGMFPEDITHYVDAIREQSDALRLGFHGHHNLGMGVANALRAYELGVEIIDTSLQGFGRSTGNTPTEQFICALIRRNVSLDFDIVSVMDVADKYIRPLIRQKGITSVDMISGLSLFHSSYMPIIEQYAEQYEVDPRRLIMAVCAYDKINAPTELVESQAKLLANLKTNSEDLPCTQFEIEQEQAEILD